MVIGWNSTLCERLDVFGFDFINLVLSKLLSPLLTRGGRAIERGILRNETLEEGGTDDQRMLAYESLRRACVELRTVLQVLWSFPEGRLMGIVALPLRYRLIHRLPDLAVVVNDAFLGVAVVGRREAVDAAATMAKALQAVTEGHNRELSRRSRSERSAGDWRAFDYALSQFVAATRRDLGIRALDMPEAVANPS